MAMEKLKTSEPCAVEPKPDSNQCIKVNESYSGASGKWTWSVDHFHDNHVTPVASFDSAHEAYRLAYALSIDLRIPYKS